MELLSLILTESLSLFFTVFIAMVLLNSLSVAIEVNSYVVLGVACMLISFLSSLFSNALAQIFNDPLAAIWQGLIIGAVTWVVIRMIPYFLKGIRVKRRMDLLILSLIIGFLHFWMEWQSV